MDAQGNLYDPKTKKLVYNKSEDEVNIQAVIKETEVEAMEKAELMIPETKTESPIAELIKKQVQEAVAESIKEIDLKSLINQAIKDALK